MKTLQLHDTYLSDLGVNKCVETLIIKESLLHKWRPCQDSSGEKKSSKISNERNSNKSFY